MALEVVLLHSAQCTYVSLGVLQATVLSGRGCSSDMNHHTGMRSHLLPSLGSAPFPAPLVNIVSHWS